MWFCGKSDTFQKENRKSFRVQLASQNALPRTFSAAENFNDSFQFLEFYTVILVVRVFFVKYVYR